MSATAKREAMRGGGKPPSNEVQEVDQELDPHEVIDSLDLTESPDEPEELDEDDSVDALPLPANTVEEENGDWVYTIQHEGAEKLPFTKVRIPAKIFAKDIRRSTIGRTDGEVIFYLLCSVSKVPAKLMDKLDAKDYAVLSRLMQRRALGNSRAALASMAGQGSAEA